MKDSLKKSLSAPELLDRARRYCAMSEQCESGVRQKLIAWGAASTDVDPIIASLRSDDYLNDVRYARAYAESKILQQHWGRQKVLYQLRLKHLSKEAIAEAMRIVGNETYNAILTDEAAKKLRSLGGEMTPDTRHRLQAFLASRGFTIEEINQVTNNNSAL